MGPSVIIFRYCDVKCSEYYTQSAWYTIPHTHRCWQYRSIMQSCVNRKPTLLQQQQHCGMMWQQYIEDNLTVCVLTMHQNGDKMDWLKPRFIFGVSKVCAESENMIFRLAHYIHPSSSQ